MSSDATEPAKVVDLVPIEDPSPAPSTTDNKPSSNTNVGEGLEESKSAVSNDYMSGMKSNGNESGGGGGDGGGGVFSGWGFNVNAVTNNIGGLFKPGETVNELLASLDTPGGMYSAPEDVLNESIDLDFVDSSTSQRETETLKGTVPTTVTTNASKDGESLGKTAAQLATAATAEFEHASRAAQATFGKAAQELGRGWGTLNTFLDDMLGPDTKRVEAAGTAGKDIHTTFRELFPHLESDDEVVDHYGCTLLQKYRCYLNNATPEKMFPLRGRLFVTMSNIAMYVSEDGGAFGGIAFGVNVPFQEVVKIQKGAKAMLRVVTKAQTSFIFAEFESDTHFNGALSLLEQLAGAAGGSAPGAAVDSLRATDGTNAASGGADDDRADKDTSSDQNA